MLVALLPGCAAQVAPLGFLVPSGEASARADVAVEVREARSIGLDAAAFPERFADDLDLGPVSICDAASVVVPALGIPYDCSATGDGTVTIGGTFRSSEALYAALVRAIRNTGASVYLGDGFLTISGVASGTEGAFNGSGPPGLSAELNGVEAFTTSGTVTAVAASGLFANGIAERRYFPASAGEIVSLARVAALDIQAVERGPGSDVFGSPGDLQNLSDLLAGDGFAVSSMARNGASPSSLEAIARGNGVDLNDEPDYGRITLAGPVDAVAKTMAEVKRIGGSGEDIRFEAAFVRVSHSRLDNLGLRIGASFALGDVDIMVGDGGDSLALVAQAVSQRGRDAVDIRPSLTAAVGAAARFVDGSEVPVLVSSSSEDGQTTRDVEYRSTGVVLDVRGIPQPDGSVRVQVIIEVSEVIGTGIDGSPVFATRSVNTIVHLGRGRMVLLSGLSSKARSGVNGGGLSLSRSRSDSEAELAILLRADQFGGAGVK